MSQPKFFTVVGDFKSILADSDLDSDIDPQFGVLTATVTFYPLIQRGAVIHATGTTPKPLGLVPTPTVGFIDRDGTLKLRSTVDRKPGPGHTDPYDYTPIRLLADGPVLELDAPLSYAVSFTDVEYDGREGYIKGFTFTAPSVDCELNLITMFAGQAGVVSVPNPQGVGIEQLPGSGDDIWDGYEPAHIGAEILP